MESIALPAWLQPYIQLGSFGLLAYIVAILYPRVRKEDRDEREKRDKCFSEIIDKIQDRADKRSGEVSQDGKDRWQDVTRAIERQTLSLNTAQTMSAARIEEAVKSICKGVPKT